MVLLRREVAYGVLGTGAVLALVTGAQGWWSVTTADAAVSVSGNEATGSLSQALGIVGLAGLLLAMTLGRRGGRILGAVLALVGVAACIVGLLRPRPSEALVRDLVQATTLETSWQLQASSWNWAYAASGLLVCLGGILVVLGAPRWTSRAHRFDRRQQHVDLEDPHAIWKALDAGVDPTDGSADPTGGSAIPSSPDTDPVTRRKNSR